MNKYLSEPIYHRLLDPEFKEIARRVLKDLGLKPTFANFKEYDEIIDWRNYVKLIGKHCYEAECYLLDGKGNRIIYENEYVTVTSSVWSEDKDKAKELIEDNNKREIAKWLES